MISLVLSEIKKLFKNKIYLCLLIAIMVVPLGFTLYGSFSESGVDDNGNVIKGMAFIKEKIRVNKLISGEVTKEWLEEQKDLYNKLYPEYVDSVLDHDKMAEVYGSDWKENKELYKEVYEYSFHHEERKHELYYEHYETRKSKNTFTLQYLLDAISYGEFILNEEWENYDKTERIFLGYDENGKPMYHTQESTSAILKENELVKESFRKTKHFYYGETIILKSLFNSLKNTGVLLGYFILVLFSSMFNKEEKEERNALLKTTKNGKRKLICAKILTTIIVSILIPLLLVLTHFLVHIILFGIPDFFASFQIVIQTYLQKISHLTFGEVFIQVIGILIVGSFTIAIMGMILSSVFKSSYHSLIVGFLILAISLFVIDFKIGTFGVKTLMPLEYMNYSEHLFVNTSTIGKSFYNSALVLKSIIIPIFLLPIPYFLEKRKEIHNR